MRFTLPLRFSRNGQSKVKAQAPIAIRATYDASRTTRHNETYWSLATDKTADGEATASVRKILRRRARYEVRNNSYAAGILSTRTNHVVGRMPRLQLLTNSPAWNSYVEWQFSEWANEVRLGELLRLAVRQMGESGEAFQSFATNPKLKSPVKLWLTPIEPDRVSDAGLVSTTEKNYYDGIWYDEFDQPVKYSVLDQGFETVSVVGTTAKIIQAPEMIHLYHRTRPGQHRGVPDLTPALPLFAQLRRFTLAVLDAAETAADFSAVLESTGAVDEADDIEALDTLDLERRMATTLPLGWKLNQLRAEQPATTYPDFKRQIMNEIARCLNMPLNVALCDSSQYNYASGRLDHQTYFKDISIEQDWLGQVYCTRVFLKWLEEARFDPEFLAVVPDSIPHQWFWDGLEHVDPTKEADAQATRLANNTTTLALECAKQGLDWEDVLAQRSLETKRMKELGLEPAAPAKKPFQKQGDEDAQAEK